MMKRPTRGKGFAEKFLSNMRRKVAEGLIPSSCRDGRIIDIGCGTYPYFLECIKFKEKYGLDRLIENSIYNGMNLVFQDIEEDPYLSFEDNFFDAVTLLAVVEHLSLKSVSILFKEIYKVLKAEGVLIVTTPHKRIGGLLEFSSRIGMVSKEEIAEHKKLYTPGELCGMLSKAGFSPRGIESGYFELGLNIWIKCMK